MKALNQKIATMFPKASKSFVEANPHLTVPEVLSASTNESKKPKKLRGAPVPNKTESEFGIFLESQKSKGEILRYIYHGIKLQWGDGMYYTPDWFIVVAQARGEYRGAYRCVEWRCIECKGPHIHYAQQAIARFKGAKAAWPEIEFEFWQKTKDGWNRLL